MFLFWSSNGGEFLAGQGGFFFLETKLTGRSCLVSDNVVRPVYDVSLRHKNISVGEYLSGR